MKKINLSCEECEATYTILHDMSPKHYFSEYCPFCGSQLPSNDDIDEEDDDEENEDEYADY